MNNGLIGNNVRDGMSNTHVRFAAKMKDEPQPVRDIHRSEACCTGHYEEPHPATSMLSNQRVPRNIHKNVLLPSSVLRCKSDRNSLHDLT